MDFGRSQIAFFRELVLPEETRLITEKKISYLMMPIHEGSLHDSVKTKKVVYAENEAHTIFYQVCEMVLFCHRIGIFFRDFKLRKFVFSNAKR